MNRMDKRIPLATPTMHGNEMRYIQEAFQLNWIAPLGFNVDAFESEMSTYLADGNAPLHALALSSGTAGLHLAVKLAGVKPGDTVFCSDMTFVATANPVIYEGGCPVFIDSERETWNMDPAALEKAFEKHPDTRAVILVHLYGTPSKLDEIQEICRRHGAVLIEDAAESLAATYRGRQTGTFGQYGILSFNGNKIITTSGGGMLLSASEDAIRKAFYWAAQAREQTVWYQHEEVGYNYRMSNVVAGVGRGQLKYLNEHRAAKEAIYHRYQEGLRGLPVTMNPYIEKIMRPNFWLSCMLIDEGCSVAPMEIYERLIDLNIETRPLWKPMHMQPLFLGNDLITVTDHPVTEDLFARGLCLPSDIKMTPEEQESVIQALREMF